MTVGPDNILLTTTTAIVEILGNLVTEWGKEHKPPTAFQKTSI